MIHSLLVLTDWKEMYEIVEIMVNFITRYLLPRTARLRLFALEVHEIAQAMPPAVCMRKTDVEAFMWQVDQLCRYYRLEGREVP